MNNKCIHCGRTKRLIWLVLGSQLYCKNCGQSFSVAEQEQERMP